MNLDELLGQALRCQADGRPFVVYRKPEAETVQALFQTDATPYPVDFSAAGYVFAPFDGVPLWIPAAHAERHSASWKARPFVRASQVVMEDAAAREHHVSLVRKGVEAIRDGRFDKVVLSRRQSMPVHDTDCTAVFRRMLDAYPEACVYLWWHPSSGYWMGAFAEQLAHVSGHYLTTMALAGTRVAGTTAEWGEKEQQEQRFVTEAIEEALAPFSKRISKGETETITAGRLEHIRTMVLAALREDVALEPLVYALHPTPAVCGRPKEAARDFILQEEGYDRQFYAGFHGEVNLGWQTDLFVNLRCLRWTETEAHLFIGGGITADSDAEKEWEETVNKAGTMAAVLAVTK
ncbi:MULTISPECIES: chorismate-binding protein [unclassified Flavobacterium]|uniref:chorismate-binding protein n=1 Tax=unclassified Flavobacterium TaxID=196869 RepID=UPI001F13017F|nr:MULTISPECIES: chorismate-binding protein [unclassified Flavobacterium]UMY65246.1 chorismate-binding protein [Flavobacterium sp. HJ-32-4]